MPADAEEQVRTRGAARRSDQAKGVSLLDRLAGLDMDLGEMEVFADEAVAMVDQYGVAFIEQILRHHNRSIGNGQDRRTNRNRIVDAHVRTRSRFAVEDSLHTK